MLGESDFWEWEGERFAVVAVEEGFGVEGVDVRWAAFHKKEYDAFGAGTEMGLLGCEGIGGAGLLLE